MFILFYLFLGCNSQLILNRYSDPSSVANLTQAGKNWPSGDSSAATTEERQISFEMTDEGILNFLFEYFILILTHLLGVESVILFAWWKTDSGDIYYERLAQQILVTA